MSSPVVTARPAPSTPPRPAPSSNAPSTPGRVFSSPVRVARGDGPGTQSVTRTVQTPVKSPHKKYVPPPNAEVMVLPQTPLFKKKIRIGADDYEYGLRIGEMTDSTDLYRDGDHTALRARLETEGYIYIRGGIDPSRAAAARAKLIAHLAPKGAFAEGTDLDEAVVRDTKDPGWTVDAETGGQTDDREDDSSIEGWRSVGWSKELRDVYAGDDLKAVFRALWGQERTEAHDGFNMLSNITWIRAKGRGQVTAEHADYYYFRDNTTVFSDNKHPHVARDAAAWNDEHVDPALVADAAGERTKAVPCDLCGRVFARDKAVPAAHEYVVDEDGDAEEREYHCVDCARQPFPVYTCWMSLGEYHSGNSSLCMMPRSHKSLTEFHTESRAGLLPGDYPKLLKAKWAWHRGDFGLGDIVIFNIKTVHGASKNLQNSFRFSMDTRVSARWFRPQALYGAEAVDSDPVARAPVELSAAFVEENKAARAALEMQTTKGLLKRFAKGGMGMGGGMGGGMSGGGMGGRKARGSMGIINDVDDDDDDDADAKAPEAKKKEAAPSPREDDDDEEEEKSAAPQAKRARSARTL